ncbi:MAG: transaldolase [Gemmatimonadaceae bacterium]|nr:transaldolase [Gemmatimonadaceae bacterium]
MTHVQTYTKMHALLEQGQSVWLDDLRRGMIVSGELDALIADGLRGMTSNPTIFEAAIADSTDYDAAIRDPAVAGWHERELFEKLAVDDVRAAADRFRPVYEATDGADGFVSIEVNPALARDTEASLAEARRLWREIGRPNVMIKIPGTREGWAAIERGLAEGMNINITLLFSVEHYRAVALAYIAALEARVNAGQPIHRIASVASFFVSRVDTEVDKRIEAQGPDSPLRDLRGQVAMANATLAYARFRELFAGPRWEALLPYGARVQRPLWASTSTKNPAYGDVRYIEGLIGPDTVTTIPLDTLRRFEDHGGVARTVDRDVAGAHRIMDSLARGGIDFAGVARTLEEQGIRKFADSYDTLLGVLREKRARLAARA